MKFPTVKTFMTCQRSLIAALLAVPLFLASASVLAQRHSAPLQVIRSATLERPLLVISTDTSTPREAYMDDVHIRVAVENDFRVYRAFHRGVTRTLHIPLDAEIRYAAFDPERDRFVMLAPGLRVELENYDLLDPIVAAVGGTRGKAYPVLGFAIVQLPPHVNPVEAVATVEALPGVVDVRLMIEGPHRVPN